jgi:hypothetical protein
VFERGVLLQRAHIADVAKADGDPEAEVDLRRPAPAAVHPRGAWCWRPCFRCWPASTSRASARTRTFCPTPRRRRPVRQRGGRARRRARHPRGRHPPLYELKEEAANPGATRCSPASTPSTPPG